MYLCTMKSTRTVLFLASLFFLVSCGHQKQEPIIAPWGEVGDSADIEDEYDLEEIQAGGELIILTMSGPETYYDYRGRQLGAQYMLAQRFANKLGVRLRVDVCRDTTEMLARLSAGDADLIAYPLRPDSLGWVVGSDKEELRQELTAWYRPEMLDEVRKEERFLLSARSVKRRVFSPMLNRAGGVISHYDALFARYCQPIHWDWRLMAAQCYQESTFDPHATSWAGAKGLMQIMPSTADHLGLPRDRMYDPESSIAAAARYLRELEGYFMAVRDRQERIRFVLASYNGGRHHITDAMALARRDGRNPHRWRDVEHYVLNLNNPQYYRDPLVKNGYMRGSETVDYVTRIMQRWDSYRGVRSPHIDASSGFVPQKATRRNRYDLPSNPKTP